MNMNYSVHINLLYIYYGFIFCKNLDVFKRYNIVFNLMIFISKIIFKSNKAIKNFLSFSDLRLWHNLSVNF